jgi:hypothetical protein
MFPFSPGRTFTISATHTSGTTPTAIGTGGSTLKLANSGTNVAFIAFGNSTVIADETLSYPVMGGTGETITIPSGTTHLAATCLSGQTATLYVTRGDGF